MEYQVRINRIPSYMRAMDYADRAYALGYVACSMDIGIANNQYECGTEEWQEWQEWRNGWLHYDADYNPDYYSISSFY